MTAEVSIDDAIHYLKSECGKGIEEDQAANRKLPFIKKHVAEVAGLKLPKGQTADDVAHIVTALSQYIADKDKTKPLSFAIFGPPGSGKSTFVKNISKQVEDLRLVKTANLTQVANSEELANALKDALKLAEVSLDVPLIFFDEFDSMCEGTPLGWLRWFLAPMEDGAFLWKGEEVKIGKAVFIFAGGTAETLDNFVDQAKLNAETFRARKVPDFVSRLRGAINIEGINGSQDERIVRRALALGFQLSAEQAVSLGDEWLKQILQYGFFVHGARSLKAYVEAEQTIHRAAGLSPVIRRQHVTRGEFDGVMVGISASLDEDETQQLSEPLSEQLLRSGATLAYAGASFKGGTLPAIIRAAQKTPSSWIDEDASMPRVVNYMGIPAIAGTEPDQPGIFKTVSLETIDEKELRAIGAPTEGFFPALPEIPRDYRPEYHAAWAISLFRLRLRAIQDISALVALGGKDDGKSWGRLPGVAEEVMIAIALGKPVYVLGGAGGAAQAIGRLLGLGKTTAALKSCLVSSTDNDHAKMLELCGDAFAMPGIPDSPKNLDDLRRFLFARGVSTSGWPSNGLSVNENRKLFECNIVGKPDKAVELILRGLKRVC